LAFLEEIWPEVKIKVPDATLITTYSSEKRLSNDDMDKLYKTSDVLAYPCSGQERYCLTAIKAQIYGTIPCIIPNMALQDTVQFGDKCLKKDYVSTIIALLTNDSRRANIRKDMIENVKYNTWEQVVAQWEALIG
jgi:glycosyltransferase involved in cell wall biosynthesis